MMEISFQIFGNLTKKYENYFQTQKIIVKNQVVF